MWTVVYIVKNKTVAMRLENKLTEEGILVKIKPLGNKDGEACSYEILVLASEVDEAMEVINTM